MIPTRLSVSGDSRICPHCKETILKSAMICPGCHHYLQFDAVRVRTAPSLCPLRIEGRVRYPDEDKPCEYSVVVEVQNDRGEVLSRRVMGVGTMRPREARTFSVRVELSAMERPA